MGNLNNNYINNDDSMRCVPLHFQGAPDPDLLHQLICQISPSRTSLFHLSRYGGSSKAAGGSVTWLQRLASTHSSNTASLPPMTFLASNRLSFWKGVRSRRHTNLWLLTPKLKVYRLQHRPLHSVLHRPAADQRAG